MIQTLQCPSCGAPLEYDEESERETIRCHFCASTVMLPSRARQDAPPRVVIERASNENAVRAGVIVAFVAVFVTAGVALYAFRQITRPSMTAVHPSGTPGTKNSLVPSKTAPAEPAPFFGSEGIGPGNFKDARSIAVDAEGHIYVGEYMSGRIQVFDQSGKFVTQWTVDPKMPLRGMTADRRGTVYVIQKGEINKYEGTTGRFLGTVGAGGGNYDDACATPDGGLVAFTRKTQDNVVRIDPSGQVKQVIESAVSGQTDRSELSIRVAADGVGNVYALGEFNNAVFKFSSDGRFQTRFGGDGDEPGLFRAPGAIAVDNQGRVYVADFKGIQIFDPNGRYLDLIKVKGAASGLVFTDKNELLVVARTAIWKFPVGK
ncbi:MAG: tripartite motif-containing protein 71 [Acidobacteriota bacterium]|jgi:streptogramin lyase/DNA-directed RNA polymerase subunit RPC12/RpoP|nr:tripartite motif-containing protein 71 [Acidobacteriota bacterium]